MMCKQVITFDTSMLPQGELKIILNLAFSSVLLPRKLSPSSVVVGNVRLCLAVWTDLFWGHLSGTGRGDKLEIIVFSSP